MAGHSKWAGIKHKKAIVDSRRGKLFTKLARAITVAAKDGGGDPDGNPALGTRDPEGQGRVDAQGQHRARDRQGDRRGRRRRELEEVVYEGYGPGGVALLIEALTDNRNRTGSDVRHAFAKHGGSLGEPGSVAYLFDKTGVIVVDGEHTEDDLMVAIDAGAEDIAIDDDVFEILCEPADLAAVRAALEAAGIEFQTAEVTQRPKTRVELDEDGAKLMRLIDALEDNDDVGEVHANFEVDAEVLERVAGYPRTLGRARHRAEPEGLGDQLVGRRRASWSKVIVTMITSSAPYSRPPARARPAPARARPRSSGGPAGRPRTSK